jgi:flagella basal body P-ring formation protein FlgA
MKKCRNSVSFWCGLILAATAATALGQEVRLRQQATVTCAAVLLGDVAQLQGLPASAGQISLAKFEPPRTSISVTLSNVQDALRREGVNIASVSFAGAARCTVTERLEAGGWRLEEQPEQSRDLSASRATADPSPCTAHGSHGTQTLSSGDSSIRSSSLTIAGKIQEQLAEQLGASGEELTVVFAPACRQLAQEELKAPASITSTDRNLLGRRSWRVDCEQNGRTQQRYVTATVRLRRPTVVSRHTLNSGAIITADDVERVLRDDEGKPDRLDDLEAVVGQQVRKPLTAGQIIAAGDLKNPTLIQRGQLAWVQAGPVQVRARAVGPGGEGQMVEFENLQSKSRFSARITGPGRAEIAAAVQ